MPDEHKEDTSGEPIVNPVNAGSPAEQGEGKHTETGTDEANADKAKDNPKTEGNS